ncbi:Hypothetical predicted protein [Octopus vulgaris]|uniref:Uncharacterized protein n=1 Tax=Octopus vulgaris TaxID=6645 RepID=A0AA36FH72_OCTVU|nr:Hypothetical predicted protein [Octopus vulgaris]
MTSSACKEQRCEDEDRNFKLEWDEGFAFIDKGGKALCLVCQISLSHYKAINLKCHNKMNYRNFSSDYPPKSELRKHKLTVLKTLLSGQQTLLTMFSGEANAMTEANFVITWNIALGKHPYSDGEFLEKNIVAVLDPNNTKPEWLITQTPVSCDTTERRIFQISCDVASKIQNDFKNFLAFKIN